MSSIQELEQKVRQLEQLIIKQQTDTKAVLSKSDRALDEAIHAYRIDHAGYVWVWDPEQKHYRKTDVCVRVIIPKVKPKEITNCKIADKAVNNRTLDDGAADSRVLVNGAVKDRHIGRGEIHPDKFAPCVELEWLNPKLNAKCAYLEKQIRELRQLVTSYTKNGIALSNSLGSNQDIGITQWRLTRELVALNNRINDLAGLPGKGICVTITPDVFITELDGEVALTVTSSGEDILEKVKIYVNDNLIIEKEWTEGFIEHFTLHDTSVVKTVVQIMGVEYTDIKVVTKLFPFFIGSGLVWQDAETVDNAQVYRGHLNGSYDMTVKNDGDKIYVIIPKRLAYQMIRVDMNGFEVPMVTHEDGELLIYESTNTYTAGRYNLDITCNCNCHPQAEETEENNG